MGKVAASARVREEWLRRVDAEYRSAAVSAHMAQWLIQIGGSPDLVRAALRIAGDELAHAGSSHRVYRAAGGRGVAGLDRAGLELARTEGSPLEDDVLRVGLEVFCLGETAAVRLFKELRQRCEVPIARRALDRILRDEVRHRDFGWVLLGWLFESSRGQTLRALASRELGPAVERVFAAYAPSSLPDETTLPQKDMRWGLMPASRYGAILEKTLRRDYLPRLARLGLGDFHARALAREGSRE
jgi:hypothetical protein